MPPSDAGHRPGLLPIPWVVFERANRRNRIELKHQTLMGVRGYGCRRLPKRRTVEEVWAVALLEDEYGSTEDPEAAIRRGLGLRRAGA